jgi:hypothetical protein
MIIKSVRVVCRRYSPDVVILETDLPVATFPYSGTVDLSIPVSSGQGERYALQHFPDLEIRIDRTPAATFAASADA